MFLNLLLSMLAALQAPIIMMSQNRQAAKDRLAAALDYEVNVKSETAIAELHDKVDRLQDALDRLLLAAPGRCVGICRDADVSRGELRVALIGVAGAPRRHGAPCPGRQPPNRAFSASRPPLNTMPAKVWVQSSIFSGSQSKVVHHSTKARLPSVTGVTRKVAW